MKEEKKILLPEIETHRRQLCFLYKKKYLLPFIFPLNLVNFVGKIRWPQIDEGKYYNYQVTYSVQKRMSSSFSLETLLFPQSFLILRPKPLM